MDTGSSTQTPTPKPDPSSPSGAADSSGKPGVFSILQRWLGRERRDSIAWRLMSRALGFGLAVMVVSAILLSNFYRSEVNRQVNELVQATLDELTSSVTGLDDTGQIILNDSYLPTDPRYRRVFSGWYWAFVDLNEDYTPNTIYPSRSYWDSDPVVGNDWFREASRNPPNIVWKDTKDPTGADLRVGVSVVFLRGRVMPVGIMAGISREDSLREASQALFWQLMTTMGLIALALAGAAYWQVQHGLKPLRDVQNELDSIRDGAQSSIEGDYPSEIDALVENLNGLIEHNQQVISRTRNNIGNLAHALKNPLAVLMTESGDDARYAAKVHRSAEAMLDNVNHYLRRAQTAANAQVLGARTDIEPAVEDIARMVERLNRHKNLAIELDIDVGAVFRGERQDLDDLIGNLIENAGKWCRSRVRVTVKRENGGVVLIVDDDGPGLAPEDRAAAIQRGKRLDESTPGTGLGLSIVNEVAELYGGRFALDDSPLGGLRARLDLPAAPL